MSFWEGGKSENVARDFLTLFHVEHCGKLGYTAGVLASLVHYLR
jgi:hypothetical protein